MKSFSTWRSLAAGWKSSARILDAGLSKAFREGFGLYEFSLKRFLKKMFVAIATWD
jgi:hypothetical protein